MQIYLDRTWATTFLSNHNFAWYFDVSENTTIVSGHFQNYGVVQPSLYFWRALTIYFLENKIDFELVDNGRPKRTCKILIYDPCEKITVKRYGRMWDTSKKM